MTNDYIPDCHSPECEASHGRDRGLIADHSNKETIRTLVAHGLLLSRHIRGMQDGCPYLQHFSLLVTLENAVAFGKLLQRCPRLKTLVIRDTLEGIWIQERENWLEIGKMIPGCAKLRWLEICMNVQDGGGGLPLTDLVECVVGIIKRVGVRVGRLLLGFCALNERPAREANALCRIMDCCAARFLTHFEVDIKRNGRYTVPKQNGHLSMPFLL